MKRYYIDDYIRIDRRLARRKFNSGIDILLVPCNVSPSNSWGLGVTVNINNENLYQKNFDKVVNLFQYYNCNHDLGYYPAYYVKGGLQHD